MTKNQDYVLVKNILNNKYLNDIQKSNPIQILNVLIEHDNLYEKYRNNSIIKKVVEEYKDEPLLFYGGLTFTQIKSIDDYEIIN